MKLAVMADDVAHHARCFGKPTLLRVIVFNNVLVLFFYTSYRLAMILAVAPSPLLPLLFISSPRPAAGFPSPAADFVEGQLDLNRHLVRRPASTFIVRIAGNSLDRAGIHSGDLAVVDRSLQPSTDDVVVVVLYGELLVKRLRYAGSQPILESDSTDPAYKPYPVPLDADFQIWGVVTNTIRQHRA